MTRTVPYVRYILPAWLMLAATICFAQKERVKNLSTYDTQKLHFGFSLGINSANFVLKPIADLDQLDSVLGVEPRPQSGFNLGIVSDLRLNRHLNLRFLPALSFAERDIIYRMYNTKNVSAATLVKKVESTFLMFPFTVKYRSARINNYRAFLLGGISFALDLASQEDSDQGSRPDEVVVRIRKNDLLLEAGFGLDFYLQYFKFSPELKIAYGLPNLLVKDQEVFSQAIDKLRSKLIIVSFYFE